MEEIREQLKEWREDNSRHSDEIIELWEEGVKDELDRCGDEKWMILEQVAVAAMDTFRPDIVDYCLSHLANQFGPASLRFRRLVAMQHEMREEWGEALEVLESILEEDESNSSARKRKIAIARAQGDNPRAIQELCKYLKVFMSDQEAWLELCDIYIQEQDYAKASFCCEELLLHNPHNHLYHQRNGDIRYTMGGFEQLEIAKQFYSQAVKLASSNMRALYGLLLTTSQLASNTKCPQAKRKEYLKVALWTRKQISSRYAAVGGVENMAQLCGLETLMGTLDMGKAVL